MSQRPTPPPGVLLPIRIVIIGLLLGRIRIIVPLIRVRLLVRLLAIVILVTLPLALRVTL